MKDAIDGKYDKQFQTMAMVNNIGDSVVTKDTVKNITTTTTTVKAADMPELKEKLYKMFKIVMHQMPKVMFFMVPFMAFLLKLFFFRRKELYFVEHAVFSLHAHTMWFIIQLPFILIAGLLDNYIFIVLALNGIVSMLGIVYIVAAISKAYQVSLGMAIGIGILTLFFYSIVSGIIMIVVGLFYADKMGLIDLPFF